MAPATESRKRRRRPGGRTPLASISGHRIADGARLRAASINIWMNRARDLPCSTTRPRRAGERSARARAGELSAARALSIRRGDATLSRGPTELDDAGAAAQSSIDKIVVSRSSIATTRRRQNSPASPPAADCSRVAVRAQYVVDLLFGAPRRHRHCAYRTILHPVKSPRPAVKYCPSMKFATLFDYLPRYMLPSAGVECRWGLHKRYKCASKMLHALHRRSSRIHK